MKVVAGEHASACHFADRLDSMTPREVAVEVRTTSAGAPAAASDGKPILEVTDLVKEFPNRSGALPQRLRSGARRCPA